MKRHVDSSSWDEAVLGLGAPHVLQSAVWGAFKSRWGWRLDRFTWSQEDRIVAAAQVLTRRPARSPFTLGYAPKGPLLLDREDVELWSRVLTDLRGWAWDQGLTLLKIDPDVPADAHGVAQAWSSAGWRKSASPVQFPNTMLTDLTVGEEALLAAMQSKTRYNVRLSGRREVVVRRGDQTDLKAFYRLYAATGARGGFGVRDPEYYFDIWHELIAADRAVVLIAERDSVPLAGVVPVIFGPTAWYLYGASSDEGRQHMPAYAAQWESLRWAIERGCRTYDWWGGPTALDESDPLWGVYRFKSGFGAALVEQMGAWDLPVRRVRYALFERLEAWRRQRIASANRAAR